ncbi:hypothetical protein [Pseudoalteromonas luteoviolacea]|uniref:Uncharacterized protein n=1 Tax=Pseudoalteromonas luteoviolacea NCIMB 1942 TaxID=1365253 RepID=A0A167ESP0_9GAMM|nr:hypothetical protein [Pseudoalteromonas luteoviolacea]KZN51155.1 hypothetical protein N482_00680 [Pseudoalteromonas luteoviolacea NCIMB 1942]
MPNVDTQSTIQVCVKLDDANSTKIFGFRDQYISLNIKGLDQTATTPALSHELGEEVSQIDTSVSTTGSTWPETHKQNSRIDRADNRYNLVDLTLFRSFVVQSADQNTQIVDTKYFGFPDLNSMELNVSVLSTECSSGISSTQYFQKIIASR